MSKEPNFSFEEFLTSKGGAGLIATLYGENMTFSEILDNVDVVESTLSVRRDEASDLGLVKPSRGTKDGRRANLYSLTHAGERLAQELERKGTITNYEAMVTHKRQFREGVHAVVREIYATPSSFFMFPSIDEETFIVKGEDSVVEDAEQHTVIDRIEETEQVTLGSEDFGDDAMTEEELADWKMNMQREGGGPDGPPLPDKYKTNDDDEEPEE